MAAALVAAAAPNSLLGSGVGSAHEADGHYTYAGSSCYLDGKDPQNGFFHWNNSSYSNVRESSIDHVEWTENAGVSQYFFDHGLCLQTNGSIGTPGINGTCTGWLNNVCDRYHMRFRQGYDNSELDGTPYTNAAAHWEEAVWCDFDATHAVPPSGFNDARNIVHQRFTNWGHYTHTFYKGNTTLFPQACGEPPAGSDGTVSSPHGHWG